MSSMVSARNKKQYTYGLYIYIYYAIPKNYLKGTVFYTVYAINYISLRLYPKKTRNSQIYIRKCVIYQIFMPLFLHIFFNHHGNL